MADQEENAAAAALNAAAEPGDDGDESVFDASKKKKKKKKGFDLAAALSGEPKSAALNENAENDDPAAGTQQQDQQAEDEDGDADFSKKKKKKKKVKTLGDGELDTEAATADAGDAGVADAGGDGERADDDADDVDEDFDLKKKKKKKKVTFGLADAAGGAAGAGDIDDEDDDAGVGDASGGVGFVAASGSSAALQGSWLGSDRDYTYEELLERVFRIMHEKNPEHAGGEKKRFIMQPPQVVRVGSKKTSLANFSAICKTLKRQPRHLLSFLLAELGTTGSVDANNQLLVKGRFQQKQIETVLRRYIKEYVTCHTCRSPDTLLEKDEQTRVVFLQCETCGSRCSVTKVQSGYQAQVGKRAAMRAKAT